MIRWSREAEQDLDDIFGYIAHDSVRAALSYDRRLRDRAEGASLIPNAGRMVPEIGRRDVREVFL